MNRDVFDCNFFVQQMYEDVKQAEREVKEGKITDAKQAISRIREKYGI